MSDRDPTATIRVRVPYHRAFKALAARLGRKEGDLAEEALAIFIAGKGDKLPPEVREIEKARAR